MTFIHVTFSRGRDMGILGPQKKKNKEGQNETCKTGELLCTLFSV